MHNIYIKEGLEAMKPVREQYYNNVTFQNEPPTVDSDTGVLLNCALRSLTFLVGLPDINMSKLSQEQQIELNVNFNFVGRTIAMLRAHAANQQATLVPYQDMVQNLFKEMDTPEATLMHAAIGVAGEGGEILDRAKKSWVYKKPVDLAATENILEEMGDTYFYMQKIMLMFGWTLNDLQLANRLKLGKRYSEGKYSDKQAQDRADKVEVNITPST